MIGTFPSFNVRNFTIAQTTIKSCDEYLSCGWNFIVWHDPAESFWEDKYQKLWTLYSVLSNRAALLWSSGDCTGSKLVAVEHLPSQTRRSPELSPESPWNVRNLITRFLYNPFSDRLVKNSTWNLPTWHTIINRRTVPQYHAHHFD